MHKIKLIFMTVLVIAAMSFTAFADEFTITDPDWYEDNGYIYASWNKCESSTGYKLVIYKIFSTGPNQIGTASTSFDKYNLTALISKSGTGSYYYSIYPVKGGESYVKISEELEVDNDMLYLAKDRVKNNSAESEPHAVNQPGTSGGPIPNDTWEKHDGKWMYRFANSNNYVKNAWKEINGRWYYFDGNGIMQTGWIFLQNRWYYLASSENNGYPEGACYMNTTTPDGYTVNEKGEWHINGVVQTEKKNTKASSSSGSGIKLLDRVSIGWNETTGTAGDVSYIEPTNASGCNIEGVSYSTPVNQWTAGTPYTVTLKIKAGNGYAFKGNPTFTTSRGKVISASGTGDTRTVSVSYTPVRTLAAPEGVYIQNETEVHWTKSPGAKKYKVNVYVGGRQKTELVTEETWCDISEWYYDNENNETVSIKITAIGPNDYIKNSSPYEIADVKNYYEQYGVKGHFTEDGNRLSYTTENGEDAVGWHKIGGYWYHFKKTGAAEPKGWWQDTGTGYWYYFGSDHRMKTGYVTDNGVVYFLNDGTVTGLPEGAWV